MASVGEVKALLASAVQESGEGHGAIEQAREYIGAAIEKAQSAGQLAGAGFDGSSHDHAAIAQTRFIEAESKARAMMGLLEDYASAIMAGQEACNEYIGLA
jgi:hypothetical protein